jgi:glycosyltransferase involved in cell wall biosynthesis
MVNQFIKDNHKLKIKLYHFEWNNNFADARNFGLSKVDAKSQYVLTLDADEAVYEEDLFKLKNFKKKIRNGNKLYKGFVRCVSSNTAPPEFSVIRIFPNHPKIRYVRSIHEHIDFSSVPRKFEDLYLNIQISHDGYDKDVIDLAEKKRSYLAILEDELTKNPNDYLTRFYYGQTLAYFDKEKGLSILQEVRPYTSHDSRLSGLCEYYINTLKSLIRKEYEEKEAVT